MSNLNIEVVENGFIVHENNGAGIAGRMWVFNVPEKLADHIQTWGKGEMKTETYPTNGEAT